MRGFLERTAPGVEIGCVEFVPDTRELQDVVQKRMDVVEQLETALGEVERRGVDLVAVRRWLEGSNEVGWLREISIMHWVS